MKTIEPCKAGRESYPALLAQARSLLEFESDPFANAANLSALLFAELVDLNWVGFYFTQGEQLVLGPFQGKPACTRIPFGKGVCGTAALKQETIVVPHVHAFPGHIACDSASQSEIVVPLVLEDAVLGVLDLDSPSPARFDEADKRGLEQIVAEFMTRSGARLADFLRRRGSG